MKNLIYLFCRLTTAQKQIYNIYNIYNIYILYLYNIKSTKTLSKMQ